MAVRGLATVLSSSVPNPLSAINVIYSTICFLQSLAGDWNHDAVVMMPGRYELRFAVGDHFRSRGIEQGDPPFLDIVPLRFSIAEPEGHYHVPLLISPYGYSTYRGS